MLNSSVGTKTPSASEAKSYNLREHFDAIYSMYFPRMYRFAKEYVLFDEEAENIVQDVFLFLWEKREVLTIRSSLRAYLFTLVKNRCLNHLRQAVVANEYKQELAFKLGALERFEYNIVSDEEMEKVFTTALAKLPERCRIIFLKNRIEGKKYREIAEELHLSVNTVENQICIALRKLRKALKDYLSLLFFL